MATSTNAPIQAHHIVNSNQNSTTIHSLPSQTLINDFSTIV